MLSRRISSLSDRCLIYSVVIFIHQIEFMYVYYNFLHNSSTLHNIMMFNISLSCFIIFIVYLSHMKHMFSYNVLFACCMCECCAELNYCILFYTYIMTYYVCSLHVLYIADIYLSIYSY